MPPDGHRVERAPSTRRSAALVAVRGGPREQQLEAIGCGNLGAPPKPPHSGSYSAAQARRPRRRARPRRAARAAVELTIASRGASVSCVGLRQQLVAPVAPRVVDGLAELDEAGAAPGRRCGK